MSSNEEMNNNLLIKFRITEILNKLIKGTVTVISSDPTCRDDNVQFTSVPLKALSDQV